MDEAGVRELFDVLERAPDEGWRHFIERYEEGLSALAGWLKEGSLKYRETVIDGIENTPDAFISMMKGGSLGKMVVRVADGV